MPLSSQIDTDNRILKEDYFNYDLIARYWNDEYQGRIWKNKEKIAACDGDDLDEIMTKMKAMVDDLQAEKRNSRAKRKLVAKDYANGLRGVEPKLSRTQKLMLSLQMRAPGHLISVKSLVRLGDYGTAQKGFDAYLDIANRLSDELAYTPAVRQKGASAKLAILCGNSVNSNKVAMDLALSLRPELVDALEILGW